MDKSMDNPEVVATFTVSYVYTYEFRNAQIFEVQPYLEV
jgi:hypothetical protein